MDNGYEMILYGLNQLQKAWEEDNKYGRVDFMSTLKKLFHKGQLEQPASQPANVQNPAIFSPEAEQNMTPDIKQHILDSMKYGTPQPTFNAEAQQGMTPNIQQHIADSGKYGIQRPVFNDNRQSENNKPTVNSNEIDISKYSPDNPFLKYVERNKGGFVVRHNTPELTAALNAWEEDKKKQEIAKQLTELDLKTKQKEYDLMGKPKELSPEEKRLIESQIASNYAGAGKKEVDGSQKLAKEKYDRIFGLWAKQFGGKQDPITKEWSLPPGKTNDDFITYADKIGTGDFVRGYLGVPKNNSQQPTQQTNQQTTQWFKNPKHSTPPPGVSAQAWLDADYVMMTAPVHSISYVLRTVKGKVPPDVYAALVARSKMG